MTLCSRLNSLLLTPTNHARYINNGKWLQKLLEGFSLEDVLGIPKLGISPHVMIYGSCVAGTAFQDGDADYAVIFPSKLSVDNISKIDKIKISQSNLFEINREYHQNALSSILKHIEKRDNSINLRQEQIFTARVPILRLKRITNSISDDIQFDVSLSLDGIRNSLLLRLYMESDPRLRAGVLCAKKWGRSKKILDARHGWISPYALTVMYVFYMQVTGRTKSLIDESDVDKIISVMVRKLLGDESINNSQFYNILDFKDVNSSEVLDDLHGFFRFFGESKDFDFDTDVVDIRTKDKWLLKEKWLDKVKQTEHKERWELLGYETIMIRDPYESHNLGRSVDFFRAEDIRETFRLASQKFCFDLLNL